MKLYYYKIQNSDGSFEYYVQKRGLSVRVLATADTVWEWCTETEVISTIKNRGMYRSMSVNQKEFLIVQMRAKEIQNFS